MIEGTLKSKLFRCVLAVVLAAGLALPAMGALAWGDAKADAEGTSAFDVSDKLLDDAHPSPSSLPVAESPTGEDSPSADVAPAGEEPSSPAPAASPASMPRAGADGFADYNGLSISGGTPGESYALETVTYTSRARGETENSTSDNGRNIPLASPHSNDISTLVIKKSGTYVLKNTNGQDVETGTAVRIEPGLKVDITLQGVNINSELPFNIATNSQVGADGLTVEVAADDVASKTTVHLTLADGTVNRLYSTKHATVTTNNSTSPTQYQQFPALRCGEGSVLVIDDEVRNVDTAGRPIVPSQGQIPAGTTYVGRDGKTHTATSELSDLVNSLSNLQSADPGELHAYGGLRSAAIGGGPLENAGSMTFNGGVIEAVANDKGSNGAGCGIGGGHAGGSTATTFNGGVVRAYASFHGAAIGGGCTYVGGMSKGNQYTYPLGDALISRSANSTVAGDITVNGGFIEAYGAEHSNAFGQGCSGNNNGKTILITGGTLLPHWGNGPGFLEIGGDGGYVIITGGSVNCTRFQGNGVTAGQPAFAWGDLEMTKKVSMISVDVGPKIEAKAKDEGIDWNANRDKLLNTNLESWELLVNKMPTAPAYGAPARLDVGKLYLWLPEGINDSNQIDANFSYYVGDKLLTSKTTLPEGSTSGGSVPVVKEWNIFTLDETFVRETWSKYYDGLPLEKLDVAKNPIPVSDPAGKSLNVNDNIKYNTQQVSEQGKPLGSASTSVDTPADAGFYDIEVRSDQYAVAGSAFVNTYWGHAATGRAVISPVTSKTSWELVEPLKLEMTDAEGNKVEKTYDAPTWAQDENAGNFNTATNNHLVVPVDVTSDKLPFGDTYPDGSDMSRPTCQAPTGRVQLYVDDRAVPASLGGVIEFDRAALESADFDRAWIVKDATGREHVMAYFDLTRGQLEAFGLEDKSAEGNEHRVYVEYTSAMEGAGPRDEPAVTMLSDAVALAADGGEPWAPAHNDSSYMNYYESANESAPVEIELAMPDFRLYNERGTGYVPADDSAANLAKVNRDPSFERDWVDSDGKRQNVSDAPVEVGEFRDEMSDDGVVVKRNQDWFPLFVETNSIGDIVFTSSNPGVISIEPNDTMTDRAYVEGKTDYGVGAKAKVVSAGKTTITATIKGTGAYASVSKSFDVYIFPDLAKEPQLSLSETAYDMSRADGTIRPGDTLRYIVTAANDKADTACINPVYELGIPADTEFKALTIVDPEGREVTADYEVADGKVVVASLPTLFGGQAYRFKLDVTVKPDVVSKKPGEKADFLSRSEASGIYGVNPDKFEWDDRIPAEGKPVSPVEAQANPTLPPSPDATPDPEPEPIVPDDASATEILGGDLEDPAPVDPTDPDGPTKPGVPVGPVKPDSPFDDAVLDEPANPDYPDRPEKKPEPVREGDVIISFGDDDDPKTPDDIAKELDEQIKKKLEEDPDATEVEVPVTVERPDPDDPDGPPIEVDVIITVPITPEMRPEPPDPDDRDDHDLVVVPSDVDPRPDGDITTEKRAENVTPGFAGRPNQTSALVGDTVRFTITVSNSKLGSAYYDVLVKDPLPAALAYVPGSAVVTDAAGKTHRDFKADWDAESRVLGFCLGDVAGGQAASVAFDCVVTPEALTEGATLDNVAVTLGTQPSQTLPGPDPDDPDAPGPIVIDREPTPPGPYDPEDHGSTWDDKEGDVIEGIKDAIPDLPEDEEIVIPESEPASPGTPSPSDPKLVDDEEGPADVKLAKTAQNLDRDDGSTHVGDVVRYVVTVSNAKPYSMWYDAVVRDEVPVGLEILSGTIRLTDAAGAIHDVPDAAYDVPSRVLSVVVGDLPGGASVAVAFDALVTEEAVGGDVGNTASAHGVLPSTLTPEGSELTPGGSFTPPEGWPTFIEAHPGVVNPQPTYPSRNVGPTGGVVSSDDEDLDAKRAQTLRSLAQTGDETAALALVAAAALLGALAVIVLAGRRRRARLR